MSQTLVFFFVVVVLTVDLLTETDIDLINHFAESTKGSMIPSNAPNSIRHRSLSKAFAGQFLVLLLFGRVAGGTYARNAHFINTKSTQKFLQPFTASDRMPEQW